MVDISAVFPVLTENSNDIVEVITKFGDGSFPKGLVNIGKAMPALKRIMDTVSAHKDPVAAVEQASRALIYSQNTKARVTAFQKKHGLEVDGLIGDETWAMVEKLLAGK